MLLMLLHRPIADDRLLLDIGITREQAEREASKPFWMSGKSPRRFTSLQ
jgi:hypothetical protein